MNNRLSAGIAGISIAAVLLSSSVLGAKSAPVELRDECTATVAQQVTVRSGEQDVRVTVSEALADSTVRADVARESNLRITGVTKAPDNTNVTLKVDASGAAPGTWALTITAGQTTCTGEVKVAAAEPETK